MYKPLLSSEDSEDVVSSIRELSRVNLDLGRGLQNIGTSKDTKKFRGKLHDLLQRGSSLAQRISIDLKHFQGVKKPRLVQQFRREALHIQQLGKDLSLRERQVLARLSSVDEEMNRSMEDLGIAPYEFKSQTQAQISVPIESLEVDVSELRDRELGLRNILSEMDQLNGMMKDISELIEEQQEAVDNIEDNIVSTQTHTVAAEGEIVQASTYQKRARSWLCYLLLVMLVVLFIVAMVVLHKYKRI